MSRDLLSKFAGLRVSLTAAGRACLRSRESGAPDYTRRSRHRPRRRSASLVATSTTLAAARERPELSAKRACRRSRPATSRQSKPGASDATPIAATRPSLRSADGVHRSVELVYELLAQGVLAPVRVSASAELAASPRAAKQVSRPRRERTPCLRGAPGGDRPMTPGPRPRDRPAARCHSGAPWMIGGDSRSRFRPEQGFWSSERRVEVACASAAGLWTARWAPCPAIVGTADACSSGQGWPRLRAGASG